MLEYYSDCHRNLFCVYFIIRAFVALIFLWLISYKNKLIHPYLNLILEFVVD
jgi:hypothetical protein